MEALEAADDRAGALLVAQAHGLLLQREFGANPEVAVVAYAEQLRVAPPLTALSTLTKNAPTTEEAGQPAKTFADPSAQQPRLPVPRRPIRLLVSLALTVFAIAFAVILWTSRSRLDPMLIAALPFRVSAADSTFNYLRDGSLDLLSARLTGDNGQPRAVDSRTISSRFDKLAARADDIEPKDALKLARSLGAGRLLMAEFVVNAQRTTLSGRVLRVSDGNIEAEDTFNETTGKVDETVLVERLIGRLLAKLSGEHAPRVSQLSDSISAVKAYLIGRQKHRRGEYDAAISQYERALGIDSFFAYAAFFRAMATNRTGSIPRNLEARKRAWSLRFR